MFVRRPASDAGMKHISQPVKPESGRAALWRFHEEEWNGLHHSPLCGPVMAGPCSLRGQIDGSSRSLEMCLLWLLCGHLSGRRSLAGRDPTGR